MNDFRRKHYVVLADALGAAYGEAHGHGEPLGSLRRVVAHVIRRLAEDNPAFDVERFTLLIDAAYGRERRQYDDAVIGG